MKNKFLTFLNMGGFDEELYRINLRNILIFLSIGDEFMKNL